MASPYQTDVHQELMIATIYVIVVKMFYRWQCRLLVIITMSNMLWNMSHVYKLMSKTVIGSGGIQTHASEETGALNQRLRPLGHATFVGDDWHETSRQLSEWIAHVLIALSDDPLTLTSTQSHGTLRWRHR